MPNVFRFARVATARRISFHYQTSKSRKHTPNASQAHLQSSLCRCVDSMLEMPYVWSFWLVCSVSCIVSRRQFSVARPLGLRRKYRWFPVRCGDKNQRQHFAALASGQWWMWIIIIIVEFVWYVETVSWTGRCVIDSILWVEIKVIFVVKMKIIEFFLLSSRASWLLPPPPVLLPWPSSSISSSKTPKRWNDLPLNCLRFYYIKKYMHNGTHILPSSPSSRSSSWLVVSCCGVRVCVVCDALRTTRALCVPVGCRCSVSVLYATNSSLPSVYLLDLCARVIDR